MTTVLPPGVEVGRVHAPPLRVLHLIDNLGMGGAETWLVELLRHWRRQGGQAPLNDFIATGGRAGVYDEEAMALGARIFYLPYGRRTLPAFVRDFRRILKDGRYDAIHDHQDYASGWHYLMGAGRLSPVRVTHVHNPAYQIRNNYGVSPSRRVAALIGKTLVGHYATHIVGTSRQAIREYGFEENAFRHIPKAALHCGFDTTRFRRDATARRALRQEFAWDAADKVVLFAGRIDLSPDPGHPQNHKNSGFAVTVAIEAARLDNRMRFLFAGPPSEATPVLEARIAQAGLAGRVVLAGIRKDVHRLMAGADVLFFPSRSEGLGMVAVEAQASGLPVLASTGVPREAVVTPELVEFRSLEDDVQSWARSLIRLAARDDAPPDANHRVAASPFSIEHSAAALERLYGLGRAG